MVTFVMLIKVSPELAKNFKTMEQIGKEVGAKYKAACPEVNVTHHLALLGPYDFMDVLDIPSVESAYRLAAVIRSSGMASTVVMWPAIHFTYPKMRELLGDL